jgi:hypothetical protein
LNSKPRELQKEVMMANPGNLIIWKDTNKRLIASQTIDLPDKGRYWVLGFNDNYVQTLPLVK